MTDSLDPIRRLANDKTQANLHTPAFELAVALLKLADETDNIRKQTVVLELDRDGLQMRLNRLDDRVDEAHLRIDDLSTIAQQYENRLDHALAAVKDLRDICGLLADVTRQLIPNQESADRRIASLEERTHDLECDPAEDYTSILKWKIEVDASLQDHEQRLQNMEPF